MPRTNKKEQPKCKPSTSAFFIDEKATEPLLKVVPNMMDGKEMTHPQNSLKQKSIFLKERCSWLGYPDSNQE